MSGVHGRLFILARAHEALLDRVAEDLVDAIVDAEDQPREVVELHRAIGAFLAAYALPRSANWGGGR